MKQLFIFLTLLITLPSFSDSDTPKITSENQGFSKALFAKKWFLNKVTINGKEDHVNYPINKDYYQFNMNGFCVFYEGTFETSEKGTWRIYNNRVIVKLRNETRTFIIKKLNNTHLELAVSTDDPLIHMYFSK
ncbi:MAG: lipocalin family protein [Flavobacteriales bacterium]